MGQQRFAWLVGSCVLTFLLVSCPQPIDQALFLRIKDDVGPTITVISPADGSFCAKMAQVIGVVSDASTSTGDIGAVRSLHYEILSAGVSEEVDLAADGSFTFGFSTASLASPFVVRIAAEDWNGNTVSTSMSLRLKENDDIPSFSVDPDNQKVTLKWDDVPFAESYSLYYTTEGSLPSENYGAPPVHGISSDDDVENLENGSMHVFLLHAHPSSGDDNYSDYAYAIPLSPQTLAPMVVAEPGQMSITWPTIDATDQFEVWRSSSRDGIYTFISGTRTGNQYVDRQVIAGSGYFYSVKPALAGSKGSGSVYRVTHPFVASPVIGSIQTASSASAVEIVGNYALVAEGWRGLQVIDVSFPESPAIVQTIDTFDLSDPSENTDIKDICVVGNLAYLLDGSDGIHILDVTNPALPVAVDTVYHFRLDPAFAMDISGDHAFVTTDFNGLVIVDINPTNVATYGTVRDFVAPLGSPFAVDVVGDYAYVSGNTDFQIVDVTDVTDVSIVKTVATPDIVRGITVAGDYAYAAHSGYDATGLQVIDINPIASAAVITTIPTTGLAQGTEVVGDRLYLATGTEGLLVFDITTPDSPRKVMHVDTIDSSKDVAIADEIAYVADGSTGLRIIDTRNPSSTEDVTTVVGAGLVTGVAVSGDYAYATDGMCSTGGLRVIDLQTQSVYRSLGTPGCPQSVVISGSYAYLCDKHAGLQIIDIRDNDALSIVGTADTPGAALRVTLVGDYAYVADDTKGVQVIDISNPATPQLMWTVPDTTGAKDVAYSDGKVFVSTSSDKFHILDVHDPLSASILKTIESPEFVFDYPFAVAVSDGFAYVADSVTGVQVIDIADVQSAAVVNTIPTSGQARELEVAGPYLLAALGSGGVDIIDISDPLTAFVVKELASGNFTYDVTTAGDQIYIADGNGGLRS